MSERAQPSDSLERSYQHAPIGLCYFDTDLRYVHINDWLASINGLTVQQHLGQRIGDILPEVAAGVESQLRHVIETAEPVIRGTAYVETPAHPGSRRHYEHSYHPDKSKDGTVFQRATARRCSSPPGSRRTRGSRRRQPQSRLRAGH